MSGFRWFDYCPKCGVKTQAETQLVLQVKIREHIAKCEVRQAKKAMASARAAAQGALFK